jgi:hypothetical protein
LGVFLEVDLKEEYIHPENLPAKYDKRITLT